MAMKEIDYCYHTHTSRCGHAYGTDEEYVLKAIELGYKELGFSDHIMIPGIVQPGIRGDFSLLEDYIQSILSLKEKYKDKIKIYLGFECEYSYYLKDYYKALLEKYHFDYLILGQHAYVNNNKMEFYFDGSYNPERFYRYVNDLIEGMRSGLFTYVCHPDLYVSSLVSGKQIEMCRLAHQICQVAQEMDIPIEINLGGDHLPHPHPNYDFFDVAKEYNLKFIFGCDAHNPDALGKKYSDKVKQFLKRYPKLNIINRLEFKNNIN